MVPVSVSGGLGVGAHARAARQHRRETQLLMHILGGSDGHHAETPGNRSHQHQQQHGLASKSVLMDSIRIPYRG
jgi:hypothetical protein